MVRIVTDAAADISTSVVKEMGIEVLPFIIHLGDKEILADANLQPQEYYKELRNTEEFPKTCQMSPADIEDIYRRLGKDGEPIIHITISGNGSGINNTSMMIAQQLNDEGFDITVVNSETFSYVIGGGVVGAAEMANKGASKEEILKYLEEYFAYNTAYFLVDDLTFLQKGGRIKATTMAVSSILDIKPILNINDGLVEAYKKVRGLKKAIAVLAGYVQERMDNPQDGEVIILHSDAQDKVDILKGMVEDKVNPASIKVMEIGPIISSHAGLGVVGILFRHKEAYKNYDKS